MTVLALAFIMLLVLWAGVLLAFASPLVARWHEPVLKCPVLIIESDDWGAGPLAQADVLHQLADRLQGVRDRSGRPALMTLGVVLEVPDGDRIAASNCTEYHALSLAAPRFEGVRTAIQAGMAAGVFAPQLHGQCHYWPPALLVAAQANPRVREWLTASVPAATEDLPSHLQSRWVDASSLPSRTLAPEVIKRAVATESTDYRVALGHAPRVAVATTFVWNDLVETAWAEAGIEAIITPGRRATCRAMDSQPACFDRRMLTGEHSLAGQIYLVRDIYFEPALGHSPQRVAEGLVARTRQGRACLVETHRFNFLQAPDASLADLQTGLRASLVACPTLRFATSLELARAIRSRDPEWIESRLAPRLAAWRARLDEIPRFRRLARLSGLALPLGLLGGRA